MKHEKNKTEILKVEKKTEEKSPLLEGQVKSAETPEVEQIVLTKSSFWEKILLKLSIEEKAVITENIIEEIGNKPLYWVLLITSVIIATLGLLQNSVAIIIGAMLIAPLLRPIKGLAFGITTGQPDYFWMAFKMLFMSVLFAVFTAYSVSLIVPLKIETAEIIARTEPNLLDLMIAIAAGMIAILSLYFKKLSENIAGVAMAAAILPPLTVTGIELALQNNSAVFGSFFLFVTNLFAILAVGVIIFFLYGFFPIKIDLKHRTMRIVFALFLLLVFISFPLGASLRGIVDRINLKSQADVVLNESFEEKFPGVGINVDLNIVSHDKNMVQFSGRLKVPTDFELKEEERDFVQTRLVEALGREVSMDLEIVPVVKFELK